MKRSTTLRTIAVVSGLGMTPLLAAEPPAHPAGGNGSQTAAVQPAKACVSDVRAFTADMSKQGYWLGGSDYSYGYPMGAYGYGYGYGMMTAGRPIGATGGYATARPGYEIRTLVASANILAQTGNQSACESVLGSARALFTTYAAGHHNRPGAWADQPGWREREIAAALPVTNKDASFRSDQLLDADVVSTSDVSLGSVHDLVTNPQTGKIAYVIVSRGGLFGIDASYTPVPWNAFKATSNGSLLILDTSKAVFAAAPQGSDDQFTKTGQFGTESQKVESYWMAHIKLASAQ